MNKYISNHPLLKVFAVIFISYFSINTDLNAQNTEGLYGFPEFNIIENNAPDIGYHFLCASPFPSKKPFQLIIMDNYGTPVFYKYYDEEGSNFELQATGQTSWRGVGKGDNKKKYFVMDASFKITDSVEMIGFNTNGHEFRILSNGNYLLMGADRRTIDMSQVVEGGDTVATIVGVVIQELDLNHNLLFEWNSWDHFEITDSYQDLTASSIKYVHPNALEVDENGNIFLLCRAMNEVTKINRQTGEIIWRLGGKNNMFSFSDSADMFSWPHDIRLLPNGNITLFDNGNDHNPSYSRAVEYELNTDSWTASLVWEYTENPLAYSDAMGSTRRLSNGNTIIGYGSINDPGIIEVHPDNSKAFHLNFAEGYHSYRALKFPWNTTLFETNIESLDFGYYEYVEVPYLLTIHNYADSAIELTSYSTLTNAFYIEETFPIQIPANSTQQITLVYDPGSINTGYIQDVLTLNSDKDSTQRIAQQVHLYGTRDDFVAPAAEFSYQDAVNVPLNVKFTINFGEAVRYVNDTEFDFLNVDEVVIFKKDNSNGENVEFDAVISTDRSTITIFPIHELESNQSYFLSFTEEIEDYTNNAAEISSSTIRTIDNQAPVAIISPANEAINVYLDVSVKIVFDESVRALNNTEITDQNINNYIDFRENNSLGNEVNYSSSINFEKTEITLKPNEFLTPEQVYLISINSNLEDYSDNAIDTITSVFTTGTELATPEIIVYSDFEIFPNPGNGIITVNFMNRVSGYINIFDYHGSHITDVSINNSEKVIIDFTEYPDGLYLIQLKSLNNNFNKVFIKH